MESNINNKALKSGVWYTVSSFITKSIGFLTTPIFARILTHEEYGLFSNITSWLGTFVVLATLNLSSTFISAKHDHKDSFDQYVSSMLVLSSLLTGMSAIVINAFPSAISACTGIDKEYLNVLLIYAFFYSAVELYQNKERYSFGYKKTVLIGLGIALSSALLSVYLVKVLKNHLQGRVWGFVLPTVVFGAVLYIIIIKSGKGIRLLYWKYAIPICLPYVPHLLSLYLLNSMDKMMITQICGPEQNALYSVSYTCGAVITMLATAINTAFAPWLGEKLQAKQYEEIHNVSKQYILFFAFASCGIMILTPELLLIVGNESYLEAKYVMPPVSFGCVCQFIYMMYVNVEQFNKKTIGMAIASVIAAVSNYILNMMLIPQFGYVAAAYTTLISYMILLFVHMFIVERMNMGKVYPIKYVFGTLVFMTIYTMGINYIFHLGVVRYVFLAVYIIVLAFLALKWKSVLLRIIKR